ncbi:UNVERIFIED_CONTAM: putative mitochondrial protein [Sesamum latifolium]|uniref:Mitochondrial protein n=1 Tax=Sesamum latifolium TaxID=2727402 RepID=A0AAW2X448_9LAMI
MDQLAICDPVWPNVEATKVYANLRDQQHVWHLHMTLRDEFEYVRSSLLHRSPLPKLDIVIKDLICEEIQLNTLRAEQVPPPTDIVLATHAPPTPTSYIQTPFGHTQNKSKSSKRLFGSYCKMYDHVISECRRLKAKQNSDQSTTFQSSYKVVATTTAIDESFENSSPKFSMKDIQALFQQLQPEHGKLTSQTLSVTEAVIVIHVENAPVESKYARFWGAKDRLEPWNRLPRPSFLVLLDGCTSCGCVFPSVLIPTLDSTMISDPVPGESTAPSSFLNPHPGMTQPSTNEMLLRSMSGSMISTSVGLGLGGQGTPFTNGVYREKLESRARLYCFLGYGIEHKGYRCWDPISKRLRISRHVTFWEYKMFSSIVPFQTDNTTTTSFLSNPIVPLFPDQISTVARLTSVRSLIAITAARQWKLFQMDIKNAFLNGIYLKRYICNLLLGLTDVKVANAPMKINAYFLATNGDPTDHHSIIGFCFFLGASLISWPNKKQSVVSRSSTESEYRALADTASELLWLRWLL